MKESSRSARAKTADDLEWARLEAALMARCTGASARARGVRLAESFLATSTGLAETAEAMQLLQAGERLPLDGLKDVRMHLQRLQRHGILEGPPLAEVQAVLRVGRQLGRYLAERRQRVPALLAACAVDPSLRALEDALAYALEPDGSVADRASLELKRLRDEVANLREHIGGRLEQLMQQYEAVLQDRYFTLREGRFVLPVRRDAHERVPGIVHGTSASGASIFVEPRPVVALGNRFKMAQGEMEREEMRILGALSEQVRDRVHDVVACADAVDHADLRQACAQLGVDMGGVVPELLDAPCMRLLSARHPLLVLGGGRQVVPNDLALLGGHGLVVSGPNAGGKTVALKTLGLAAWMVRVGLPLPVAEGSQCGFFEDVLTDMGDDQSTLSNLSTFSSHMTNIASILHSVHPRALVLLDELAGGTDPEEGAALACGIVDALCRAGAAVAVTTHYEPLKAFALTDPRLRNASVGFDVERMEPTFELMLDVPGASSALVVAQRFGVPTDVIAFARQHLPENSREFDQLAREMGRLAQTLQEERRALLTSREALEEDRAEVAALRRAVEEAGRQQVSREAEALIARVRETRASVEAARALVTRAKPTPTNVQEAERLLNAAAASVAVGGELDRQVRGAEPVSEPMGDLPVAVGDRVYVSRLRSEGTVVEGPRKERVRVAVGPMRLWVDVRELRKPGTPSPDAEHARPGSQDRRTEGHERAVTAMPLAAMPSATVPRTSENSLDLRGMRVDDAMSLLETFIDRLYGQSQRVGYVLHGHGTGALRDAVRTRIAELTRYGARSRAADRGDGGDAVTVIELGN